MRAGLGMGQDDHCHKKLHKWCKQLKLDRKPYWFTNGYEYNKMSKTIYPK